MSDASFKVVSDSPEMTKRVGACIAQYALPGALIALRGDLGAGKTCFVQGLARVLAHENDVHSPTFTIVNEYGEGPALYHIDLYRIDDEASIRDLALEDVFDAGGIVAIEWAERAESLLPKARVDISLEHCGEGRQLTIENLGMLKEGWADALQSIGSETNRD